MSVLPLLFERAKAAAKTIVLPEGQDPRVISAACKALDLGIAKKVIVLGSEAEIAEASAKAGITERPYEAIDYLN
ncbi:MAG: phosphate acetyltransferase, partial [Lentisphaeria bacterium]|nr:phosphate acetyltransferase [Lentisphaeria bacterium]